MELKNAVTICLITLFSATLVMLIARSLDSQAASRLEPQLAQIVEELRAIRAQGGLAAAPGNPQAAETLEDGLMVYYFHGDIRCPTCEAIESQAHETVENDFADELKSGEMAWKVLNYDKPESAELARKFDVHMANVVLARIDGGEIEDWKRLDQVWGLVGDTRAFAEFLRTEVSQMLHTPRQEPTVAEPGDGPAIPLPGGQTGDLPLPGGEPGDLPRPAGRVEISIGQ